MELELESRADAKAPKEALRPFADGPRSSMPVGHATAVCRHCQRSGHTSELCPRRAAEARGDLERCAAESERTGKVCGVCGFSDHREEHRRLAALDAHVTLQPGGQLKWSGGKIHLSKTSRGSSDRDSGGSKKPAAGCSVGSRGSGGGSGSQGDRSSTPRPYGDKCRFLDRVKYPSGCKYYHALAKGKKAPPPPPPHPNPRDSARAAGDNKMRKKSVPPAPKKPITGAGDGKRYVCGKLRTEHADQRYCTRETPRAGGKSSSAYALSAGRRGESELPMAEARSGGGMLDRNALLRSADPQDLLGWAIESSPKRDRLAASAGPGLRELFEEAKATGRVSTVTSLGVLPEEEFEKRRSPKPPGYAAQTTLHFGRKPVLALLDWGATSSAIPEEVACLLIEYTLAEVAAGRMTVKDRH